jgi:hypothetical protein
VNRVVPDAAFESQTRSFAERLASGHRWHPPPASGWYARAWRAIPPPPTRLLMKAIIVLVVFVVLAIKLSIRFRNEQVGAV